MEKSCGDLACNGKKCALVSTMENQASMNFQENMPPGVRRMPQESFSLFLNRIQEQIPLCCQSALAQEVFNQITQQSNDFYSSHQ